MKGITYLGVLVQLIGAILLIYIGFAGSNQSNTGLIIGLLLVVFGFLIHIFLDKKLNSLPSSTEKQ
ncbi:hypothetical protein ACTML9_09265 [Porphyromonas levii]|uniref:Uncharacterized protein n=3 Tax=Porphyromonas levii TaxID=28114 RepID=A0A4Y8WMQ3_9PORP|nr:hypothetical protein [Porphyromonas levii]TFH94362.1 hypothetical protein E4P47_07805 [Porphyromonas levii]TFH96408.1 hypothetical protein E4P48_04955 [Porphyromonas levii]